MYEPLVHRHAEHTANLQSTLPSIWTCSCIDQRPPRALHASPGKYVATQNARVCQVCGGNKRPTSDQKDCECKENFIFTGDGGVGETQCERCTDIFPLVDGKQRIMCPGGGTLPATLTPPPSCLHALHERCKRLSRHSCATPFVTNHGQPHMAPYFTRVYRRMARVLCESVRAPPPPALSTPPLHQATPPTATAATSARARATTTPCAAGGFRTYQCTRCWRRDST